MTYTGAEYSMQALLKELKKKIENQGINSYDEYVDMVDDLVEEKRGYGFFSENEDLTQIKNNLEMHWRDLRQNE